MAVFSAPRRHSTALTANAVYRGRLTSVRTHVVLASSERTGHNIGVFAGLGWLLRRDLR
jgi:hypothetical protein